MQKSRSEISKNPFETLIGYNGDTVSYINKQYMIGGEIYLFACEKYSFAKRWNENVPKRCVRSQRGVYSSRCPFDPVNPLAHYRSGTPY